MSDINGLWNDILEILKKEVSGVSFTTWFQPLTPICLKGDVITVSAAMEFSKNMIESRYKDLLANCASQVAGIALKVNVVLESDLQQSAPEQQQVRQLEQSELFRAGINPKYTFDTFVVGSSNRFAHAASLAVAETPAQAYNPLFLYGGVGLGKTHLMHAIGNFIFSQTPNAKVMYVSSEKFTNDLISSIRENKNEEFRNTYRMTDVLLIDDIQFIAGKTQTEEEFFHTFNHLHQANRQIVISCDRPPSELSSLEERLRSRFEWGLTCDLQPPNYETRMAILQKKCVSENLSIPEDVIKYIAEKIESNIRELEGALTKINAFCRLEGRPITVDNASMLLRDLHAGLKSRVYTLRNILDKVSEYFDVSGEDLLSQKRTKEISTARHYAMYLCRKHMDYSLPRIGSEFGGRNHTTAMHAIEKLEEEIKSSQESKATYDALLKLIEG